VRNKNDYMRIYGVSLNKKKGASNSSNPNRKKYGLRDELIEKLDNSKQIGSLKFANC